MENVSPGLHNVPPGLYTADTDLESLLYPAISPYTSGFLDVGEGQRIYWEECGNPDGKPALFLHGGPGGGCTADYRRYFDPEKYRIVLFDQRQCGRSTPHAATGLADLRVNTTWHLVEDIEKLRRNRGIKKWLVFGGSWGSALALAYAESHSDRVSELVLRGIFTLRRSELDWYYNGAAGNLAPLWWEKFLEPLQLWGKLSGDNKYARPWGGAMTPGSSQPRIDCIAAYHDLLFHRDPAVHLPAAQAWSAWEAATSKLDISPELVAEFSEPHYALAFARIENHYFVNGGFFREGQLIAEAHKLRAIPGVIVQGAYDIPCPQITAYDLHQAWPQADYRVVFAGHSISEPAIAAELVAATDRFAQ